MLYRILLHHARGAGFPDGSARHGYEIVAPLDGNGRLDPEAWHADRSRCVVRRFWAGEPDRKGLLVHKAGGHGGATWMIDYDKASSDDDELGFHLESRMFVKGEYVAIRDLADMHVFRVVTVEPLSRDVAA